MPFFKMRFAALATALLAAACVTAERTASETIDGRYSIGGVRWAEGGLIYAFVRTFDAGGKVGICGAWGAEGGNPTSSTDNEVVLGTGSVDLDGTRVFQNFVSFARLTDPRDADGKTANRFRTSVDWRPRFGEVAPEIRFGPVVIID